MSLDEVTKDQSSNTDITEAQEQNLIEFLSTATETVYYNRYPAMSQYLSRQSSFIAVPQGGSSCSTGQCPKQPRPQVSSSCSTGQCPRISRQQVSKVCSTGKCPRTSSQPVSNPCSTGQCPKPSRPQVSSGCSTGQCPRISTQQVSKVCSTGQCPRTSQQVSSINNPSLQLDKGKADEVYTGGRSTCIRVGGSCSRRIPTCRPQFTEPKPSDKGDCQKSKSCCRSVRMSCSGTGGQPKTSKPCAIVPAMAVNKPPTSIQPMGPPSFRPAGLRPVCDRRGTPHPRSRPRMHSTKELFSLGTCVRVEAVPDAGDRKSETRHIPAVVVYITEDKMYKLGTRKGVIGKLFAESELHPVGKLLVRPEDVPDKTINILEASTLSY